MTSELPPVACTLTALGAHDQALEWGELQRHAISVEALPAGARMRFSAELEPLINDLTRREAACCEYLDITTVLADRELVVDVTSQNPDALPVISLLVGIPVS